MILGITGHRPDKLGGYSESVFLQYVQRAKDELIFYNPTRVITGMALGWDQAVAQACIELDIPFDAYLPCSQQDKKWGAYSKQKYKALLAKAASIKVITPDPIPMSISSAMFARNQAIVKDSDRLLALFNGEPGGTKNTVNYALGKIPVTTIRPDMWWCPQLKLERPADSNTDLLTEVLPFVYTKLAHKELPIGSATYRVIPSTVYNTIAFGITRYNNELSSHQSFLAYKNSRERLRPKQQALFACR